MPLRRIYRVLRGEASYGFMCAIAVCATVCLGSCVGPDFQPPEPPGIVSYTPDHQPSKYSAQGKTQHLDISRDLPAEWWELFHSPRLNSLINRALHDNPNIESACAALRVAQANVYAEVGQLFPLAAGNETSQSGKVATTPGGVNGGVAAPVVGPGAMNPSYYQLHTAQFTVSYVPDIWGGVRRQIENLEAVKENQRFMNEATFLTLTSNIAAGAIQEASLRAQIATIERLITISKDILEKILPAAAGRAGFGPGRRGAGGARGPDGSDAAAAAKSAGSTARSVDRSFGPSTRRRIAGAL